ncbi:MAG TPA: hypothetical protein VGN15_03935, partial [Ktedonobacteraceae bacterium]|nr:hypothetical protein [Ktedonobacteraceae bacterium]
YKPSIVHSGGNRQHSILVIDTKEMFPKSEKRFQFNQRSYRMKSSLLLVLTVAALLLAPSVFAQNTGSHTANPPANFKKVSTLVRLPDWLPGLGTLYVDPATLPAGPYLGYNHDGRLVDVTYMISIKDFDEHKDWNDLGKDIAQLHLKVDHTSVNYNPGHPGLQEPHYHITQFLISPAQQEQELK